MKSFFCAAVWCALLAGCAPSLTYVPDAPLTGESFASRDSVLRGRIPPGWFVSAQDSLAPALQSWLLMEDFSAEILFRELHLDAGMLGLVRSRGLDELARNVKAFHVEEHGNAATEPESYSLLGVRYSAFEIGTGRSRVRVVVFGKEGRYYECTARTIVDGSGAPQGEHLFRIQQSVLSSLER